MHLKWLSRVVQALPPPVETPSPAPTPFPSVAPQVSCYLQTPSAAASIFMLLNALLSLHEDILPPSPTRKSAFLLLQTVPPYILRFYSIVSSKRWL